MKNHYRFTAVLLAIVLTVLSVMHAGAQNTARQYLVGDVDLDSRLNIVDATAIQRDLADLTHLSELQAFLGDVDHDAALTILDVTNIQRKLADLDNSFWRETFNVHPHVLSQVSYYPRRWIDGAILPLIPVHFSFSVTGGYIYDRNTVIYCDISINGVTAAERTTERSFDYAFDTAGDYTVTVRSWDIFGQSASSTAVVTVAEAPDTPYLTDGGIDREANVLWAQAAGGTAPLRYRFSIVNEIIAEPTEAASVEATEDEPEPAWEAPTEEPCEEPTFAQEPLPSGIYGFVSEYLDENRITIPRGSLNPRMSYDCYVQITDSAGHETEPYLLGSYTP